MTPPGTVPVPAPDAAGWTLATGLSVSLHIGGAALLVVMLGSAPGAAPGPETEITLQSAPIQAAPAPDAAARLAATAPETRLQAQQEARSAAPPPLSPETLADQPTAHSPERLDALRPAPAAARPESVTALDPGPVSQEPAQQRLAAQAPTRPAATGTALPTPAQVTAPADRVTAALPAPAPPRLVPALSSDPAPARLAPAPSSDPAPARLVPAPVTEAAPARLRPEGSSPAASDAAIPETAAPPSGGAERARASRAAQQLAMQPPSEDTLERALRDRPRNFLSDRRAAPRPQLPAADGAAPDQPLHAAVLDHLRALPDIPCFAALPALDADGHLRLEVFGPAEAGLEAFRAGLEAETGSVPGMTLQAVTQGQCDTLDFIRRSRAYPEGSFPITLQSRRIASGTQLQGVVPADDGRAVALLLVDTGGNMHMLTRFLTRQPGGMGFAIPMSLQGPPVETWQLLLALVTDSPLQSLAGLDGPQQAAPVLARLRAEIATSGLVPELALIAFSLQ